MQRATSKRSRRGTVSRWSRVPHLIRLDNCDSSRSPNRLDKQEKLALVEDIHYIDYLHIRLWSQSRHDDHPRHLVRHPAETSSLQVRRRLRIHDLFVDLLKLGGQTHLPRWRIAVQRLDQLRIGSWIFNVILFQMSIKQDTNKNIIRADIIRPTNQRVPISLRMTSN